MPEHESSSSSSPSPKCPRRITLLFGYWPPTDIGIDDRHGMLWKWRTLQENYKNSGYDVLAKSPAFPKDPPNGSPGGIPDWGKGQGDLEVDYYDTSQDFWSIVAQYRPIAIMSFSRGKNNKSWELEKAARNLKKVDWIADFQAHRPHAGGSQEDFSPFKGQGTIAGDPPDRTQAADEKRDSNLPNGAIETAIDAEFTDDQVDPEIDETGDVGAFVSEYMAYHVAWYRIYWDGANTDPNKKIHFSGHTHVGVQVSVTHAERAVEIQLDELITVLPKP